MFPFNRRPQNSCPKAGICSGCEWITTPRSQQLQQKKSHFQQLWLHEGLPNFSERLAILDIGKQELRVVCDLSFQRNHPTSTLGFFDMDREKLIDIDACPALVPDLQNFVQDLASNPPPIDRASFRLRVNQHGQRGMWIDAANIDIRTLLNEKRWLRKWMKDAHIEMGQKRKYVLDTPLEILLDDPMLRSWFSTYSPLNNEDLPLWSIVGGFSQPSVISNRFLIRQTMKLVQTIPTCDWVEFGSGSGNFTLPLAAYANHIFATETSTIARQGLQKALHYNELQSKVTVSTINLQRNSQESQSIIQKANAMLVDPPRSGLHHTLNTLRDAKSQPQDIIYVSCYSHTLIKDAKELLKMGYEVQHIEGVDQFPNTPHCEWIAHFKKIG